MEEILKKVHERVAGVTGALSLTITRRSVQRQDLSRWAELLRQAADELDRVAGA